MRPSVALAIAMACSAVPPAIAGDEAPGGPRDPAVEEAGRALSEGRYGDAESRFRKALEAPDAPGGAAAGLARVLAETGGPADAVEAARRAAKAAPGDPETLVLLGTLLASAGDLEGAEETFRAAVAGSARSVEARVALGEHLRATGRRKESLELLVAANDLWAQGAGSEEPRDLVALVRGRFAIMELDPGFRGQRAETLDLLAGPLREMLPEAYVLVAEAYTRGDGATDLTGKVPNALRPLLERNPNHPDALAAAARAKAARFDGDEAAALAKKALAVNPVHRGAIEILAGQMYGDGEDAAAAALVAKGLVAHPKDRILLSLAAVGPFLAGRNAEFESAVAKVLAVDPTFGRAFLFPARALEDRRRFAEAAAMARRAVAVDPLEAEGWFALGRNLLNLGREKEAREALERSAKVDAWGSIFRNNFTKVLDALTGYATGKTAHFVLQIHRVEDAVLRGLYEEALERSFEDLRARYGFDPEVPILVEVFRDAGDFSARTLGIPGFGAVGACFGKVVTLDSPGALPPGAFAWRATAHHEVAHVFHLQMTRGRVPRWFTEGLAVHEEAVANPSWIRTLDRDLVSALANGEVKGLRAIDRAFRGPGILWAYYQSGLMCGWLEREFGWPRVLEMLRLYGEDRGNEAVVREALGLSAEEFDRAFLEHCRRWTADWKVRPRWSETSLKEFRRRSDAGAGDLEAHLLYAEACLQKGNSIDAGTALARARALAPEDAFLKELHGTLLLHTMKTPEKGMALLREALARGRDHFDLRMALGAEAERQGKAEEALDHYRRAKVGFPRAQGEKDPRAEIARILTGLGRPDEAVRELEEAVALSETDLRGRLRLAGVYEGRGDFERAARILREIVDIRPLPAPAPRGRGEGFPAADVHARLGRALARLGRHGEAADALARAVAAGRDFDPRAEDATVAGWLAEQAKAALDAGRSLEARGAATEALRLDPGNAGAAEVLRSLEK